MNTALILYGLFGGATLFFAVMLFGKFRLPALMRYYALSSFSLACLVFAVDKGSLAGEEAEHLWLFALVTAIIKAVFIPWIIMSIARRSGAQMRLQSYIRPAPSYFIAFALLLVTLVFVKHAPVLPFVHLRAALFIAISFILLGLALMVIRRDLYSQVTGFLVLENGIALLSVVTIGGLPTLIEFGLFFLVTVAALIMSMLSKQVHELYGSEDTEQLRELTD